TIGQGLVVPVEGWVLLRSPAQRASTGATGTLGDVQGPVGDGQGRFGYGPTGGDTDTDAERNQDLDVSAHDGAGHGGQQPVGDLGGRLHRTPVAQDHELVAAHPDDGVARADVVAQSAGHLDQYQVAEGVALLVVDVLEVVHVDAQHGDISRGGGTVPEPFQPVGQHHPVPEAG